jgi:hypothetical protein
MDGCGGNSAIESAALFGNLMKTLQNKSVHPMGERIQKQQVIQA